MHRPGEDAEVSKVQSERQEVALFACACCRTVWSFISDIFREALLAAERHVDGCATNAELGRAVSAAHRNRRKGNHLERAVYDASRSGGAVGVSRDIAGVVASNVASNPSPTAITRFVEGQLRTEEIPPNADRLLWNQTFASHLRVESYLFRDIFGNPFRPITITPAILTWHDGTIPRLAQAIYEERQMLAGTFDPARMNILADALLDAGCDNEDIIQHCRSDKPHVRGCWAVDLILKKH